MGNEDKAADLAELRATKLQLDKLLDSIRIENLDKRGDQITYLVSKALSDAKRAKRHQKGEVTIDRQLKLARSTGKKSLVRYKLAIAQHTPTAKPRHERVLGDLCRYLSVAADIPRTDRAATQKERASHVEWVCAAVQHYDKCTFSLEFYASTMRKMLYANEKPLVAFLFILRYYLKLVQARIFAAGEQLDNLVEALNYVHDSNIRIVSQFGRFVHYLIADMYAHWGGPMRAAMDREVTAILDAWNQTEPEVVPDHIACLMVLVLTLIGDIAIRQRGARPSQITACLHTKILYPRATELCYREQEFLARSQLYRQVWFQTDEASLQKVYTTLYDIVNKI